jgi:hypothetical protein
MGFLERIFGKKKEEKFEEKKMSLKEVEDFLSGKLKKDFEPLKESVKKEYENLQAAAIVMQDQLKILEHSPYSGENDTMLIRKAVGSRKSFVNKMKSLAQQMQKPMGDDMNSILSFQKEVASIIDETDKKTVTEYAFLKELFEKEAEKVIESFRQISNIGNELENMLKKFTESNAGLLKAQEIVSELIRLNEEMEEKNLGKLEKDMKELEEKRKTAEDDLKKLTGSDEWKTFLGMERTREELKEKLQNKKSEFVQCIAKVEKPLKKHQWSAENKILNHYSQGSFESVLSEDPRGEVFLSAIKEIRTKIAEGKMDLKDSGKFAAVIEEMVDSDTMHKILEEYSSISEDLIGREEKIELQEIPKRKSELESEANKLRREAEEIKTEIKRYEERRKRMQADKGQKLKELENLLADIEGKKILLETN